MSHRADQLVVTLQEKTARNVAVTGGKAAPLARLLAAGFPVPPALCVTAQAFQTTLAPFQTEIDGVLHRRARVDSNSAHHTAEEIARILDPLVLSDELATRVDEALVALDARGVLAVRSSAIGEDGREASYAGIYRTVLGVAGGEAVRAALLTCWRSYFSAHALAMRADRGDTTRREGMAVLIQPLIEAECAGVSFSVDPVHGNRETISIEATWGLGSGVVDGSLPTDHYLVRRDRSGIEARRVVEKPERLVLAPEGMLQREAVDPERRRAACLPEEWVTRVAQWTLATEQALGGPQDVEWAIAARHIWILQSRPIASLLPTWAHAGRFPVD